MWGSVWGYCGSHHGHPLMAPLRFICVRDKPITSVMYSLQTWYVGIYGWDLATDWNWIDFMTFVDFMRSRVMKSAILFHYPCVCTLESSNMIRLFLNLMLVMDKRMHGIKIGLIQISKIVAAGHLKIKFWTLKIFVGIFKAWRYFLDKKKQFVNFLNNLIKFLLFKIEKYFFSLYDIT